LITILTNIIANVKEDTLLLLDEPETHLHPNAIAKFIEIIHKILDEYNAYAIIATHSPIILQQVPARYVNVFQKIGNQISVRPLSDESFGADINTLNKEIFEIGRENQNYINYFKRFIKDYNKDSSWIKHTYFKDSLSLNANLNIDVVEKEIVKDEKSNTHK